MAKKKNKKKADAFPPISPEEMIARLSPSTRELMAIFLQHQGSLEDIRAAHPEISQANLMEAAMEMLSVVGPVESLAESGRPAGRKSKRSRSGDAFQIKITLKGSKPPIWRRVIVPVEIGLDRLHEVIQVAMGWTDSHLHLFHIDGETYGRPDPDCSDSHELEESDHRLCDLAGEKSKISYIYDFGDSWEHDIVVEKVIPAAEKPALMTCTAGKNQCPPEDSGGLWGFYDKLELLNDPTLDDPDEIREWMGEFNPAEFDLGAVNEQLAELR